MNESKETTLTASLKIAFLAGAIALATTVTGCAYLQEAFGQLDKAIITILENQGQEAAIKQIDKWVEEGKLGYANADKIKAAIPLGIEKLKEAMNDAKTAPEK